MSILGGISSRSYAKAKRSKNGTKNIFRFLIFERSEPDTEKEVVKSPIYIKEVELSEEELQEYEESLARIRLRY